MRKIALLLALIILAASTDTAHAQFNISKLISAAKKGKQALMLTDSQMAAYVKESVDAMDKDNPVAPDDDPYAIRLRKLTDGITEVNGIPLNFKVYKVSDVNAFACPDGSVRVFSAIMDIMDDDELMGIIGHEIGHVAMHHSKNAFKQELVNSAILDVIGSASSKAASLTESQLSKLGLSFMSSKFSREQENEADDCGYDFLVAHGRNPWGIVKSFEKLQQLEGNSSAQSTIVSRMFSSHPETKDRIAHMTERCRKDGYTRN